MAWVDNSERILNLRDANELWAVCPKCNRHYPREQFPKGIDVCPQCGAPARLSCRARIAQLVDEDGFIEIDSDISISDPLNFADASGSYRDKAAATTAKTGLKESVLSGVATIKGSKCVVCVMDFRFLGGSLGSGAGEKIVLAAERAIAEHLPLVIFCASGGARMQEGVVSLMQMARTCAAIARLQEMGLPYISVLTDPTTGGVSASFALTADIVVAEPRALVGFAGRRVIENTIKQALPDDFQTAEYMLEHGFIDAIVRRSELRDWLANVLSFAHPNQKPTAIAPLPSKDAWEAADPWKTVQFARDPARPTIRDYIANAFDSFVELHGDRQCRDDRALIGGLAEIGGYKVMLIGHQKGRNAEENIDCNFGMANPEGYRKAMRLMKLAEAWGLPVVSLVDTAGAYPGLEAEARGQAEAIGRNLCVMARLRTPFIAVVTGEGGSGGAIGIAEGDRVLMLENAVYSVISPEGCAAILWKDGKKAPEAAKALKVTAPELLKLGMIDGIVPEPHGGAQADPKGAAEFLRSAVSGALGELVQLEAEELVARRYSKFVEMGRQFQ